MATVVKGKKFKRRIKKDRLLFYIAVVLPPLLQYAIFYIGVNFNSILMAFQSYDAIKGEFYFDGLVNFKRIFSEFQGNGILWVAFQNSVLMYFIGLATMVMALFFSYYVYKKRRGASLFRVVAYLPHIISNITLVLIYKYFTENAYPELVKRFTGEDVWGLLVNPETAKGAIIAFCVFCGFGTQMMMFANAMSAIDESVSEAALLDGVSPFREFISIDLPIIFPTISTFLIVGIAGIFTNQMSLFGFYAREADPSLWTLGYYLYRGIKGAAISEYPYLAALGLLFTIIIVPITFLFRRLLNKLNPMA